MSGAIVLATGGWLASGNGFEAARAGTDVPAATSEPQILLAWQDADGQAHAGKVDREKLTGFLEQQTKAVEHERYRTRNAAVEALNRDLTTIFGVVRARVSPYADWYFRYWTKYVLMSRAARAALRHVTVKPHDLDLIHDIENALSDYLRQQFGVRVMLPSWTEGEIETSYARALTAERDQWHRFRDTQDRQLVDFVSREVTPVALATVLVTGRADGVVLPHLVLTEHHRDVSRTYGFHRGLLRIRVKRPHAASGDAPEDEKEEESGGDKITEVLVDMFSTVVDPFAARVGNLLVSATVGGVAGAMAGGSSLATAGIAGAAGSAAALVPVAALFGAVVSLASDYATNQFEERLSRRDFEKKVTNVVAATEDSIKQALTLTLSEDIDAWGEDTIADTAIDRLVINQ